LETRYILVKDMELRAKKKDGGATKIEGYAAVFNQLSEDLGGFREQIHAGAFSDVLTNDVRALLNHDPNLILGRTVAGTLNLAEDSRGLLAEITLPDTSVARDLVVSMERGDINQMSFSFTVTRDGQAWAKDGEGPWIRTIKKVARLYDVAPVTYPAYPQTEAALRSLEAWEKEHAPPPTKRDHMRAARALRLLSLDV
jgi:HK97 family phage prohead protease